MAKNTQVGTSNTAEGFKVGTKVAYKIAHRHGTTTGTGVVSATPAGTNKRYGVKRDDNGKEIRPYSSQLARA